MANFKSTLKSLFIFALVLVSQITWAISKEMKTLVTMETKANAAGTRSNEMVPLEHYEIPLSLLESDIAARANPDFVKALIFEKDGKKFLRWIINPEDSKWYKEVETFLTKNNVKPERKKYFEGYMTASRSYIVVDPKSGAEFSFKGSTDKTGGNWRDKHQTWDDGQQIRMMADFVNERLKNQPALQNVILLDEPMAFGIKEIDQGMIIRSYETLTNSGKRYVPGFAIMQNELGNTLAFTNGAKDTARYWNDHYNKPLARALAEFLALTGMTYDSPHSQNFLVEVDANNKPTGKIVLRDFGDTYLSTEFFEAVKRTDILNKWDQDNVLKKKMKVAVGILHGNSPPRWMDIENNTKSDKSYDKWGRDFYVEFEREFARQTSVKLNTIGGADARYGMYMQHLYSFGDDAGKKLMELAAKGLSRDHLMIRSCSRALMAM